MLSNDTGSASISLLIEDDFASDHQQQQQNSLLKENDDDHHHSEHDSSNDDYLEMNGAKFEKLYRGLFASCRYTDIIDKCQGRDLSFFHVNAMIDQMANSKTDMYHGGQILHAFWNFFKLTSRMNDLQMKVEFLFFEQDEVYTWISEGMVISQQSEPPITCSMKEGMKILKDDMSKSQMSVKMSLEHVEPPKWKPLLKELLRIYLNNNGFICHTFKNMCDEKFIQLLKQREPGFTLAQSNDNLFKSLCIYVGRVVGDGLDFGPNTCYSYVSSTFFRTSLECSCFANAISRIETISHCPENEHQEIIDEFMPIEELLNKYTYLETFQRDRLVILLLTVRRIQPKVSDSALYSLFLSVLLVSTLLVFELDLQDRAFQLPGNDEIFFMEDYSKFVEQHLYKELVIVLKGLQKKVSDKAIVDLFDGRLMVKTLLLLFANQKPDWKQICVVHPKYELFVREFVEPLLENYLSDSNHECHPIVNLSGRSQLPENQPEHKVHPIVNNSLANRLFKDLHVSEYSIEESDNIVQQNIKPATSSGDNCGNSNSFTSMVETDSTHWKSRRLLVDDKEQDDSSLYSLRIKESLSQYSRSFQRNEKVFLDDVKAAKAHHITNDVIDEMRKILSQFKNSSSATLNSELLYSFITRMFETWVSNIRIQYLDDRQFTVEKAENRAKLLKLIIDALLTHLELLTQELNEKPENSNLQISAILHSRAFYGLIEKARKPKQQAKVIYSYLRHRVVLNKFFSIILQCQFLYPIVRAVHKKEESMIKEGLRLQFQSMTITDLDDILIRFKKLQFKDVMSPNYIPQLFPKIYEHSNQYGKKMTTVLQFKPDPWQKEVIEYINHNMDSNSEKKKSLLVTTPTSSGKTFITMYLIERVLKNSKTDKVVFVVPTNALCNQIYAEVLNKFENEEGQADIVGVFTADQRVNTMKCRVLVTNAAMLEILLLHYSNFELRETLAYVVLDEIHLITDESNGRQWEHILSLIRCPFIALSASIGNVLHFKGWLSNLGSQRKNHNTEIEIVPKLKDDGSASVVERLQPLEYYFYHSVSDQEPQFYTHTRMHPLTVLDEKSLEKKEALSFIPEMSKDQCMELLECSQLLTKELNRKNNPLSELLFENYTCSHENIPLFDELEVLSSNGYSSYRKYVLQKMSELQETDPEFMSCLHNKLLQPVLKAFDRIDHDTTKESLYEAIPHLCVYMKYHQMLPALVFHFDKSGIKSMVSSIIEYCIITGESLLTNDQKRNLQSYISHKPIEAYVRIEFVNEHHLTGLIDILKQNGLRYIQHSKDKNESASNIIEIPLLKVVSTSSTELDVQRRDLIDYEIVSRYLKGLLSVACCDDEQKNCSKREDVKKYYQNEKFSLTTVLPQDDVELLMLSLRFGVGMHHNSVDALLLQEVEKLYRMKLLPVAIATGTLSYGISMPCKTSVIADNSMFMLKMYFQQISGRAGRRGFDPKGNVIVMNMLLERVRRYLTTNLPNLNGSFGNTNTFILRLITFCMLSELRLDPKHAENALEDAVSALTQPLSSFTRATASNSHAQHYHYARFAFEFLRHHGYISELGLPIGLTGLVSKLFYFEPDNFLFVYLLRKGVFDHIVESVSLDEDNDENIQQKARELLEVLAYLFERHYTRNERVLQPFTEFQIETIDKQPLKISDLYNEFHNDTFNLYLGYLKSFSMSNRNNLNDLILPYSEIDFKHPHQHENTASSKIISAFKSTNSQSERQMYCISSFSALSGNHDGHLENLEVIKQNIKHTITIDGALIPIPKIVDPNSISSFIVDYFDHGETSILVKENGFRFKKDADDFVLNFLKVVKKILSTFNQKVDFGRTDVFVDGKVYVTQNKNKYLAQVIDINIDTYCVCLLEGPEAYRDKVVRKHDCEVIPLTANEKLVRQRNIKMQRVLQFIKNRLSKFESEDESAQKALILELVEQYNKRKNQLFECPSNASPPPPDFKISLHPRKKQEVLAMIEQEQTSIDAFNETLSKNPTIIDHNAHNAHYFEAKRLLNILQTKITRIPFDFEEDQTEQLLEIISSINLALSDTNLRLFLDLLFNNKENCLQQIESFRKSLTTNLLMINSNNVQHITLNRNLDHIFKQVNGDLDKISDIISNLPFTEHLSQYCIQENPLWSLRILDSIRKKLDDHPIKNLPLHLPNLAQLKGKHLEKESVARIIDSLDLKEHEIYLKSLFGLSQVHAISLRNIEICRILLKSYHRSLFSTNYNFIKDLAKFEQSLSHHCGLVVDDGRIDNFQERFVDIYKIIGENYDKLGEHLQIKMSLQNSWNTSKREFLMQAYSDFYEASITVMHFEGFRFCKQEQYFPTTHHTRDVIIAKQIQIVHVSLPSRDDELLKQRIVEDLPNDREYGFILKRNTNSAQLESFMQQHNIPYMLRQQNHSTRDWRCMFTNKQHLYRVVKRLFSLVHALCYEKDYYYRLKRESHQ